MRTFPQLQKAGKHSLKFLNIIPNHMKKLKTFPIFLLIIIPFFTYSQTEELSRHSSVNEFVTELQKSKIDTICDYEIFNEKSEAMYTQYVFWKENGKTKLKKIEVKKNYPIIEIEAENIWVFLFSNIEIHKNESTKFFAFQENNQIQDLISEGTDIKEFNLFLNGNMVKFWTSSFDFQKTEKVDGKKVTNIYFEYNNNLKGKVAIDMFDLLSKTLEKKRAFIRN